MSAFMLNYPETLLCTDMNMSCNVDDREENIRRSLCKIFESLRPEHETVPDLHMARLTAMLSPSSQFSFDLFGRECLELHDQVKAKVKQDLKHVDGNISLSVDVLSSGKADSKNGSDYMCLTAHFIDQNWTLRRFVLDFSPLGGERNDSPSEIILRSLRDWEIEDKIWAITMVNGSLYDEMFETLKDKICRTSVNGRLYRVYCCGDMVKNLVVQDAYESISNILDKIEDIYSLEDALSTWENKCGNLKVAILTEQSGGFAGIPYGKPSKKGWSKVSDICDLVDKVYDLVFPLFEDGYQPANVFLCCLLEVQIYLNQMVTVSNSFMKGVATKMMENLDKSVKEMHVLLATASVMDPRLKMKYIEFSSSRLQGSDWHSQMVSIVLSAVRARYNEYASCYPIEEKFSGDGGSEFWQEYIRFVHSTSSQPVESELQSYLEEPVLPSSSDFNVLTWWKVVGSYKYPILSRMARDFLAIPFTIAVGDDALMIEQRKVDPCLVSIEPGMAKAFMCIRSWLLDQN